MLTSSLVTVVNQMFALNKKAELTSRNFETGKFIKFPSFWDM